jgi:hypothetical protein
MNSAWDYKGQPSIWTRDAELKMINNGKILGLKRREQIRKTEQSLNERKQCLTYSKANAKK